MINRLLDEKYEILAKALIASVSNKKIIVICRDNEIKERLLKVAREYGVESAMEIQVLRHNIGKQAEAVIIDEETFPFCKRKQGCCDNPLPERLQINVEKKRIYD